MGREPELCSRISCLEAITTHCTFMRMIQQKVKINDAPRDKIATSAEVLALDDSTKSIHKPREGVDGTRPGPLVGRRDEERVQVLLSSQ